MGKFKQKLLNIKFPHTYVILTIILLIMTLLTYIIPAGEYQRVLDEASNRLVVVPDSFHYIEGNRPGFFDIFLALQRGYVSAADIIFLIIFAYGYVYILIDNKTLNNSIAVLIKFLGNKTSLIIPVCMFVFGVLGSTMGIFEEVYGLVPVFMGISIALGYDTLVGGAIVFIGVATGFAAATTNPFSIGIAQNIAEVPLFSGINFHIAIFLTFQTVSIIYVMRYAKKVKNDPKCSITYGDPPNSITKIDISRGVLTTRQKICLVLFFVTISFLLYGTTCLGWYINEMAAMFLMMTIISAIISGYSASQIANAFIDSTKSIISSILVVGFTRGILIVMQEAMITDTVVYYLSNFLYGQSKFISAIIMLFIQNVINFFITGSSSQATLTIPIMAPVADIVGLSRHTTVLAYMFGDGFSDMFFPTACALNCALMNISIDKWYRFVSPLFGIMVILQVIFIVLSVIIYI